MKLTFSRIVRFVVLVCVAAGAAASAAQTSTQPAGPETKPAAPKVEYVLMTTSKGDMVIELNRETAPLSVGNFLSYVDKKFYDGTIFHRVIPTFMIQGGGFTPDMQQKPTAATIKNEWKNGLKNTRGTLAMARMSNQPDSARSEFVIYVQDNGFLEQPRDGAGAAVFAKVVAGMDVVDAIKAVPTSARGMHEAVPVPPVVIEKVVRISEDDARKKIEAANKPAS